MTIQKAESIANRAKVSWNNVSARQRVLFD